MQPPLVSAILVSFNTRELTLRALEDLQRAARELSRDSVEIWVVDNASADGSVAAIRARFPDVQIIESPENLGFGAANNAAMSRARGEYFLLLNTDAFLEGDALGQLLRAARRHPRAGVIAPRVLNADGSRQKSVWPFPTPLHAWGENLGLHWIGRRLNSPISRRTRGGARGGSRGGSPDGAPDDEGEIAWAIGACLLVRRAAYERVGGFDTRFWMYAEETDWQKTMREAGWQIVFAPGARVTHLGGASGAGSARVSEAFYRSQDAYMLKHYGRAGLLSARAALTLGQLARLPFFGLRALVRPRDGRAQAKLKRARALVRRGFRASVAR